MLCRPLEVGRRMICAFDHDCVSYSEVSEVVPCNGQLLHEYHKCVHRTRRSLGLCRIWQRSLVCQGLGELHSALVLGEVI
jgi:hypothetical protein